MTRPDTPQATGPAPTFLLSQVPAPVPPLPHPFLHHPLDTICLSPGLPSPYDHPLDPPTRPQDPHSTPNLCGVLRPREGEAPLAHGTSQHICMARTTNSASDPLLPTQASFLASPGAGWDCASRWNPLGKWMLAHRCSDDLWPSPVTGASPQPYTMAGPAGLPSAPPAGAARSHPACCGLSPGRGK